MAESKNEIKNRNGRTSDATRIITVLKGWYTTNVLPEPEFRAQEAMLRLMEQEAAEIEQIVSRAKKNGTYLKAPNGKPTKLTEYQWALVRTKEFKKGFGEWERTAQISKLMKSEPIVATGEEWKGKYELDRSSATKYVLNSLRSEYTNKDTGSTIMVSRKSTKVATHCNETHLKAIAFVTQMIENSIFLDEEPNEKDKHGFDCFRYYAVCLKVGTTDYVVRLTTGMDKNGEKYYDHMVTEMKKEEPTDQRDLLQSQVYDRWSPPSDIEDTRLISLWQINFPKILKTVDANGEPKAEEVEVFESRSPNIQLQQLSWIRQDGKVFGWFNPNTGEIILCEGCNTSTALEAFWHATFYFTKVNTPVLHARMSAFARRKVPREIRGILEKFYPELEAGLAVWFEKLGALLFVMDYARKIEKSLNPNVFIKMWRAFGSDKVNINKIAKHQPKRAIRALAKALALGKHPA